MKKFISIGAAIILLCGNYISVPIDELHLYSKIEAQKTNLEEIVSKEEITQDKWQTGELPPEEYPSYDYFKNASEGHYNLTLENGAAFAVKDYAAKNGMENAEWELKQIYHVDGIYHAFAVSAMGDELYILLSEEESAVWPYYIVTADIRKNSNAKILLQEGRYSYNSMLEWYSYESWMNGDREMEESFSLDTTGALFDSIYWYGSYYALYDYLDRAGMDKTGDWIIDSNTEYIGRNGYIADVSCISETGRINLLIDV